MLPPEWAGASEARLREEEVRTARRAERGVMTNFVLSFEIN